MFISETQKFRSLSTNLGLGFNDDRLNAISTNRNAWEINKIDSYSYIESREYLTKEKFIGVWITAFGGSSETGRHDGVFDTEPETEQKKVTFFIQFEFRGITESI